MSVIDTILETKRGEIDRSKRRLPPAQMSDLAAAAGPTRPFAAALQDTAKGARIIAEVKRASPSKGLLRPGDPPGRWQPPVLARAYEKGGAAALSVLTDVHYFWGHPDALGACRDATTLPVLRKDFIIDPYQVDESRWLGADAILLIARALDGASLRALAARAYGLGMDVLVEVHGETELERSLAVPNALIGVNNRDLATLTVDIGRAAQLRKLIPGDRCVVAESGLSEPEHLQTLMASDISAFLIGEHLAKHDDPAAELQRLRGTP